MPYAGMDESLWEKMDRCVEKVMATGKDKSSAVAICRTSVEGKSTDLEAVKIGAMISAANRKKLQAAHDAIKELVPDCCGAEPPQVESIDSAGKGAQAGHPFYGNQWAEGQEVGFEGTSPDNKFSGFSKVKIINPHSNESEVTHTDTRGVRYSGAFTHHPKAIVELDRSKRKLPNIQFEAYHHQIRTLKSAEKEVESIDSAGKSETIPMFNYIAKLHLPYDAEYLADVVAVKSVARDTIRGYSMLWGDPDLTDVETEFFLPQTDFWDTQLKGITRPLTYDHAQESDTKSDPVIGAIEEFGDDKVGRWYVAQLKRNHLYRKAVDGLISQRAVGTSSDSASQYVVRKSAGKAVWLAQWPWFASALTPTPAEPRMLDAGLPYWKSAGVDFARMGATPEGVKIPEAMRVQAEILKLKAGVS